MRGSILYLEDHDGTLGKKARLFNYGETFSVSRDAAGWGFETNVLSQDLNTGLLTVYGTSTCTIGSGTGATNCTSDVRLKERIAPITGALDKLMLIKGVTFHWKEPAKSGPEQLGIVAQDVEKVFPQAVIEISDTTLGKAKAVDYAVLVAPMVEGLRELKVANDHLVSETTYLRLELKAANDNHNMEIELLRAEVEKLKRVAR